MQRRSSLTLPAPTDLFALALVVLLAATGAGLLTLKEQESLGPSAARVGQDIEASENCATRSPSRSKCLIEGRAVTVAAAGQPLLLGETQIRASRTSVRNRTVRIRIRLRNVARNRRIVPSRRFELHVGNRRPLLAERVEFALPGETAATRALLFRVGQGELEALAMSRGRALLTIAAAAEERAGAVEVRIAQGPRISPR